MAKRVVEELFIGKGIFNFFFELREVKDYISAFFRHCELLSVDLFYVIIFLLSVLLFLLLQQLLQLR